MFCVFFFKQKTAYEMLRSLVGSEMCIRDRYRYIMDSMTGTELDDPSVLSSSRIQRIASGSGSSPEEVRELIKYYKNMKRALKGVRGAGGKFNMQRMMKRFGGM